MTKQIDMTVTKGLMEIDATQIGMIIGKTCHVSPKLAAKAANRIIDYLAACASASGAVRRIEVADVGGAVQ